MSTTFCVAIYSPVNARTKRAPSRGFNAESGFNAGPLNHPRLAKRQDLVRVVAVFGENLVGVGAQLGRRRLDARSTMGEFEGGKGHIEAAFDPGRRSVMVSDAAGVKLRIANGLRQVAYARRR